MVDKQSYNDYIQRIRKEHFPMLKEELYLDHAGTTLYSKGLLDRFHTDMISNLYGNPHSASPSSLRSTEVIDLVRLEALKLFGADPEVFDLVFTANTTAAIKLVADAFREQLGGFRYCYHADSHTSLVGVRELSREHICFESERELDDWLDQSKHQTKDLLGLFAYPAQSNLNGRRIPLGWVSKMQAHPYARTFSLLDAAAYTSTSPLCLGNACAAPDFTVISFSKIFGFPDLGGLIVKKTAGTVFENREYFGGGTVDMVVCLKEQWHIKKSSSLHDQLEDGTLPMHSIFALRSAMRTHNELFESFQRIADHTSFLAQRLYTGLVSLIHWTNKPVCTVYKATESVYGNAATQGPIVAFNLKDSHGAWVSNAEVEKLASIRNIHLRTGGLCNPGGIASNLNLSPWELRENFSSGFRCGSENDVLNGKPTGMIRVSLGAMSTVQDIERFLCFIQEFFVHKTPAPERQLPVPVKNHGAHYLYVESLTVYPIKSCSGWTIPPDKVWQVHREGLAWDREWCIIKQPSGTALSQKNNTRMALIRPELDFAAGVLRVRLAGSSSQVTVPLSQNPQPFGTTISDGTSRDLQASVCGDSIRARIYTCQTIVDFFTSALGFPCTLARFPPLSHKDGVSGSTRHSKPHLLTRRSARGPSPSAHPLLLSNESPILTITRSSLNKLNETIKSSGGQAVRPAVFRANIVLAEDPCSRPGTERAWAEDSWGGMRIVRGIQRASNDSEVDGTADDESAGVEFDFLGGCRRCQMVCVDPENGGRSQEPYVTLAKTRRFRGRVLFGVHTALAPPLVDRVQQSSIKVGDMVVPSAREDTT